MKNKIFNKLQESAFFVPLSLLFLCVLAYGLLIPSLGYYWDDLPYAYINHMFGPEGYPAFVASDRPYSAWIFMGLSAALGEEALGYHITSILFYWLCSVLFWIFMRTLWSDREKESFWAAMIFAVYPGFLGHPNAIIYNHHYIVMILYLVSLIGSLKAVKSQHKVWLWHMPAVLAMIVSQFSLEYYLGWEAVRTVIFWLAVGNKAEDSLQRIQLVVKNNFPYWVGSLGFLIWRLLVFGFPTYQPFGGGEVDPISKRFFLTTLMEIREAAILVWGLALPRLSPVPFSRGFWAIYLGLILLTAGFVLLVSRWSKKLRKDPGINTVDRFGSSALLTAIVGIVTAGLPFWLTGLSVDIEGFSSRFTLPFISWAVLLLVVMLHFLEKTFFKKVPLVVTIIAALVVGGSTGSQFWNANRYRNDWQEVQRYIIEMVHRIPSMEPGTTLVINDMRFLELYSDNSLTALVNWTYSPDRVSVDMNIMVYYLSVRLGNGLPSLEPGLPITQDYRSLHFKGSTDKLLVVYSDLEGCLRVLDDSHLDWLPADFPESMIPALALSNLSVIETDKVRAAPPENLFNLEDQPTWCTYFEEAELAAQVGDWQRVLTIGDEAYSLADNANELTEHFVFISAYLRGGQLEGAWELSQMVSERSVGVLDDALCNLWRSIEIERVNKFDVNYDIFCSTEK